MDILLPPPKETEQQHVARLLWEIPDHTTIVMEESKAVRDIVRKKEKSIIQAFTRCMLERFHDAMQGVHVLFGKYLENRKMDFSLGIVLRSMFLDYLIMLNVFEIILRHGEDSKKRNEELNQFCLQMLSDTAIHTLSYFDANTIEPEKLNGMYSTLVYFHEECFEPYAHDGSRPVLKIKRSLSQKELVNRLKKSAFPHLARKEDKYMFYSKYDHFGKMYSALQNRPVPDEFIFMAEGIRELPRSLALMVSLAHIYHQEDKELEAIVTKLGEHCTAIDKIENAEIDRAYERIEAKKKT